MIQGIHRNYLNNVIPSIGYGYIVVPHRVDRDKYVETALKRERVSVLPDQGSSIIFDCYISRSVLKEITFPLNEKSLGSAVLYVTNHFNNKPFVIAEISKENESELLREYFTYQQKQYNNNKTIISQDAKNGKIIIDVNNVEDDADIIINCNGKSSGNITIQGNGEMIMIIDGQINLTTTKDVNLKSSNANETTQSIINLSNNIINLVPNDKLNIANGNEPLVLGNELKTQLEKTNTYLNTLQSSISNALKLIDGTAGSAGGPAFDSAMSSAQLGNFNNINSEISFTD